MSQQTQSAIINPPPKARFQESQDNVSKHKRLLDLPELQRALDFALMEYQGRLSFEAGTEGANAQLTAMAAMYKLKGVLEYIHVLKNLAEKPIPRPTIAPAPTLDHRS
jgi:hypothetical protein